MSECYSFVVNGVPCSTEEEKPLLRYLRDELRLTSVKDGCSEGACGTCTILVDGKAVKACVLSTKRAAGKEIVTVEGLSEAEREAFVYAFGAVGAVQCGFCIPGMVMAGKALLDQNPNPSEAEIKKAIRGNVCRCTGYKKIIEGIALAGAILRGEASVDPALEEGEDYGVGARAFRTDVRDKVLGRGEYCDDLYLDGMAHASAVRSQYPRARVLDIDPSAALALPGVLAVLTADDVPHNKVGHLQQDWDVMIAKGDITRCVGDAICLVVAENETVLKQAKELVKVDYEPLEPVRTIQEARAADAPILHPGGNLCQQRHVTRGDARAALAQSKYVVTQSYRTPFTEHAFLEPECAVAFPYKDGVKVYTSDQGVYDTRKEISIMLGWEPERIVVENKLVGGGFGGKEDVSVQHLAVLAALIENRIHAQESRRDQEPLLSLKTWWRDIREAAAYLRQEHGLHGLYEYMAVTHGMAMGYSPLLIAFFRTAPGFTTAMYSFFSVAEFAGRTIGGAVRYRYSLPERKRFGFLFGVYQTYELMDACLLWLPYPLMLVNRAVCGFLGIQSATIRQAAVQRYIPDRLRARLNAYESMLCTAAGAVLSLAIGALGEVLDYRLCMTICGLIVMAVCWLTVFLRRRQVQLVLTDRPGETQPDTPQ